MEDFTTLYYYVTDALFFGFSVITTIILLPYYFLGNDLKSLITNLIKSACKLIRVVALIYVIVAMTQVFQEFLNDSNFFTKENFFGSGVAFFWIKLVGLPLMLQIFWVPPVYRNKWIVFFVALVTVFFFLILNERFIIIITTFHRDLMPDNWSGYQTRMIYFYLRYLIEQLLIYLGFLIPLHAIRLLGKKQYRF